MSKKLFPQSFAVLILFFFATSVLAETAEEKLRYLIRHTEDANTDALLVYKDGKMIYTYYARDNGPNVKHISYSVGKTISGILIGIAESEGLLSFDDKVKKYFPKYPTEATVRDLLNMQSGLDYTEDYVGMKPVNLDVLKMLYLKSDEDGMVNYMLKRKDSDMGGPGDFFNYSSGDTNVLMGILQKAINNQKKYDAYPWEKFFVPLGIDATFEQDMKNTFVGAAYIYMRPGDFLKVGQLLMNKGMWEGRRIVPEKYFDMMNVVAEGVQKKVQKGNNIEKAYSSHVITNLPIPGRQRPSQYKDLPLDSLMLIGMQGQWVVASPSEQFVIVKLSMDKKSLNTGKLFASIRNLLIERGMNYVAAGDTSPGSAPADDDSVDDDNFDFTGWVGTIWNATQLARAHSAKYYCSCRYVMEKSAEACKSDLKALLPVMPTLENLGDGIVKAKLGTGIMFKWSKAKYRNKNLGCVLYDSE
jgi:CubicO group peptidase (beta-lactamase class C family)